MDNIIRRVATSSGAGTAYPSSVARIDLWCRVLYTIGRLFVLFMLAIVLSVLPRHKITHYSLCILILSPLLFMLAIVLSVLPRHKITHYSLCILILSPHISSNIIEININVTIIINTIRIYVIKRR